MSPSQRNIAPYSQITRERRARIAQEFRAQLIAELRQELTASQTALVSACVSAHVQVTELTATYIRGCATPEQLRQLSIGRGQLQRGLIALGLARRDGSEPNDEKPQTIDDILASAGITR